MLDLGASTGPPLIGGGEDALTIEGYDRQSPASTGPPLIGGGEGATPPPFGLTGAASTGPPLIGGGEMASETKQTEEA